MLFPGILFELVKSALCSFVIMLYDANLGFDWFVFVFTKFFLALKE